MTRVPAARACRSSTWSSVFGSKPPSSRAAGDRPMILSGERPAAWTTSRRDECDAATAAVLVPYSARLAASYLSGASLTSGDINLKNLFVRLLASTTIVRLNDQGTVSTSCERTMLPHPSISAHPPFDLPKLVAPFTRASRRSTAARVRSTSALIRTASRARCNPAEPGGTRRAPCFPLHKESQ